MKGSLLRAVMAAVVAALLADVPALAAPHADSARPSAGASVADRAAEFVVLYRRGVAHAAARRAVRVAGGTVIRENLRVGVATVRSGRADFVAAVGAQPALAGAARNRPVATTARPAGEPAARAGPVSAGAPASPGVGAAPGAEPLADRQWDMAAIGATPDGAHAVEDGDRRVLVGIIDTGVDVSHPDLRGVVDRRLSRNFTTDNPELDGPCRAEPDRSCRDPAGVDEDGHGTHVAGTVAAARNGLGTAGVAPGVRLVDLRAGQDSGYFFLPATVDALTYAADHGVDVVNMSFYIDPWLYNCTGRRGGTAAERLEQRTIVRATNRALDYAHARGVTLVAAAGNEGDDLSRVRIDTVSPDPGDRRRRRIDDTCRSMPVEGHHVLSVSSVGPSRTKADYSSYGRVFLAAPGGWALDGFGTPAFGSLRNLVLAPYPRALARAGGDVDEQGEPTTARVVRSCGGGRCGWYQYLQGTSMAAPHVAGVAALVVSRHGRAQRVEGRAGLTLAPRTVHRILRGSATPLPCPRPRRVSYRRLGASAGPDATCRGSARRNGFYGYGLVDAAAAVR